MLRIRAMSYRCHRRIRVLRKCHPGGCLRVRRACGADGRERAEHCRRGASPVSGGDLPLSNLWQETRVALGCRAGGLEGQAAAAVQSDNQEDEHIRLPTGTREGVRTGVLMLMLEPQAQTALENPGCMVTPLKAKRNSRPRSHSKSCNA